MVCSSYSPTKLSHHFVGIIQLLCNPDALGFHVTLGMIFSEFLVIFWINFSFNYHNKLFVADNLVVLSLDA